jgi:hypothetical protein
VKIPSEKLKLVKPFEVAAGESVSFVCDISVVKRGKNNGYNLLPVIGESGVAGKDVEANEIDSEASSTETATEASEAATETESATATATTTDST